MKREKVLVLSIVLGLLTAPVFAVSIPILKPGDSIIAIDRDGIVSNSSYPAAESPPKALDGVATTKYLNRGGAYTGFIVTPSVPIPVQSFTLTTANDSAGRDPSSWALYGTMDAIKSLDNSTGLAENWTLVSEGTVALPSTRLTLGPAVAVNSPLPYTSYRMLFPTLKSSTTMQIADVGFYATPNGVGPNLLSALDAILAIQAGPDSRYPAAGPTGLSEGPKSAIDRTTDWKYLNFGENNSGFIVTPSIGPSILDSFEITTANDSPERDPATWMLYGTNDVITSADNSDGAKEAWTLICGGTLTLPDTRNTLASRVEICNQSTPYGSYRMVFATVKNAAAANSMQIGEIQFYGVPEPATVCLLGLGGLALLRRRNA